MFTSYTKRWKILFAVANSNFPPFDREKVNRIADLIKGRLTGLIMSIKKVYSADCVSVSG